MGLRNKQILGKMQINVENWKEGAWGIGQSLHLAIGKRKRIFCLHHS